MGCPGRLGMALGVLIGLGARACPGIASPAAAGPDAEGVSGVGAWLGALPGGSATIVIAVVLAAAALLMRNRVRRPRSPSPAARPEPSAGATPVDDRTLMMEVIENIGEGFVFYDSDGRLVLCNDKFREFYGYSEADVRVGVHYQELDHLDLERGVVVDRDGAIAARRLDFGGDPDKTHEVELTDGRWLQARERRTAEGGLVSIQTDITARKRAEADVAEKEAHLRAALDAMVGGIFMVDKDLNLQVFNDNAQKFYEIPDGVIREGAPLRDVLQIRAERGDYGLGEPDQLVARRLESYADLSVKVVEDRVPSGRASFDAGDDQAARTTAHSMAGAARMAGAIALARRCSAIETALLDGDGDGAAALADGVDATFAEVEAAIAALAVKVEAG